MMRKALAMVPALWLFASAADAGYPTDYDYACSWTRGTAKGTANVRLTTAGSPWMSGTITTTYPDGSVNRKSVILSNSSQPQPGTTLWLYRQPENKVKCELYVLEAGNELVWKGCSNGTYQQCVAVTPQVRTAATAASCPCNSLSGSEYLACVKTCLEARFSDAAWATCTQDLVNLIKCAKIWWDLNVRPGEGMTACENASPEVEELCWGWVNFVQRELGGGSCSSSMQCAAGTFCLLEGSDWHCGSLRN